MQADAWRWTHRRGWRRGGWGLTEREAEGETDNAQDTPIDTGKYRLIYIYMYRERGEREREREREREAEGEMQEQRYASVLPCPLPPLRKIRKPYEIIRIMCHSFIMCGKNVA